MAIRNVGNDDMTKICDFQNDLKGVENNPANEAASAPAADAAGAQSAVQANTQSGNALRSRKTFGSQNLKAQLDSRLQGGKSASRSVREPSINNLLRSAGKLTDVTGRYRSRTEERMGAIRNDAKQFIDDAHGYRQRLEQGQNKIQTNPDLTQLVQTIGSLVQQIQSVIEVVRGNTNDVLYTTNRDLEDMTSAAATFEKSAQTIASGNASVLKNAVKAFDTVNSIPPKIATQVKSYADTMETAVEPLAKNAQTAAATLGTASDVDALSLTDVATGLANQAYSFVYNVKEKAGNFIDEYFTPITKAIGTGFKNLWNSIFNPDRNPMGKSVDRNKFLSNTQDLRNTVASAKAGDQAAITKLKQKYGYDVNNLPTNLWISTNYTSGDLVNGLVTARKFPGNASGSSTLAGKHVDTNPPPPSKLLFGGAGEPKKSITLVDANGKQTAVNSMTDYQKLVAQNRTKLGIPPNNGEPTAVHLSLEGGGGKGKRFAPVFAEMYNLGVVPASVSGVSVGAIAGALVASGLDPLEADVISKSPEAKKFFDATIAGPGILDGRELYRYMDNKLRELTGIKDRPVTFADLPIPLYLGTALLANSDNNDLSTRESRTFTFSKETTPSTPVAMAVVASAAIPGAFDQSFFANPFTGKTMDLVDGGVLKALPAGLHRQINPNNKLPEIAVQLNEPNQNNPNDSANKQSVQKLPSGDLGANNPIGNALIGLDLQGKSAAQTLDFNSRTNPPKGTFILNVPTWSLTDFSKQDSTFEFEYNNGIDPLLDKESIMVTDQFFRRFFTKLKDPNASGTTIDPLPSNTSFTRTFTRNGATYTATRANGSDTVNFRSTNGKSYSVKLGADRINTWLIDDLTYDEIGDLDNRLEDVATDYEKFLSTFGLN